MARGAHAAEGEQRQAEQRKENAARQLFQARTLGRGDAELRIRCVVPDGDALPGRELAEVRAADLHAMLAVSLAEGAELVAEIVVRPALRPADLDDKAVGARAFGAQP